MTKSTKYTIRMAIPQSIYLFMDLNDMTDFSVFTDFDIKIVIPSPLLKEMVISDKDLSGYMGGFLFLLYEDEHNIDTELYSNLSDIEPIAAKRYHRRRKYLDIVWQLYPIRETTLGPRENIDRQLYERPLDIGNHLNA